VWKGDLQATNQWHIYANKTIQDEYGEECTNGTIESQDTYPQALIISEEENDEPREEEHECQINEHSYDPDQKPEPLSKPHMSADVFHFHLQDFILPDGLDGKIMSLTIVVVMLVPTFF
jgi:hypothetical protein